MNQGFIMSNYSWQKSISVFLTMLETFLHRCFPWVVLCSMVSTFDTRLAQNFLQPSSLMMAITVSFPISVLVHSSLVMRWSSRNIASTFGPHCHCHGWLAMAGRVTNVLFTPFKTTDPASNWANINSILTIHASQMFIGLEPSAVMNSVTSLYLICALTTSTIFTATFWSHMIPWSTNDPDGAGQCHYCHYLVGKARSSTQHI